jgi:hypothetical protein
MMQLTTDRANMWLNQKFTTSTEREKESAKINIRKVGTNEIKITGLKE